MFSGCYFKTERSMFQAFVAVSRFLYVQLKTIAYPFPLKHSERQCGLSACVVCVCIMKKGEEISKWLWKANATGGGDVCQEQNSPLQKKYLLLNYSNFDLIIKICFQKYDYVLRIVKNCSFCGCAILQH